MEKYKRKMELRQNEAKFLQNNFDAKSTILKSLLESNSDANIDIDDESEYPGQRHDYSQFRKFAADKWYSENKYIELEIEQWLEKLDSQLVQWLYVVMELTTLSSYRYEVSVLSVNDSKALKAYYEMNGDHKSMIKPDSATGYLSSHGFKLWRQLRESVINL